MEDQKMQIFENPGSHAGSLRQVDMLDLRSVFEKVVRYPGRRLFLLWTLDHFLDRQI